MQMPEPLKATKAREISKASVTEAETLVVNGVSVSKPQESPMQAGDFYFRPTYVQRFVKANWFSKLFGDKDGIEYEAVETIVMSCPGCGLPILTTPVHKITRRSPLTIDGRIDCPYAPQNLAGSHAFTIKDGNIMPA